MATRVRPRVVILWEKAKDRQKRWKQIEEKYKPDVVRILQHSNIPGLKLIESKSKIDVDEAKAADFIERKIRSGEWDKKIRHKLYFRMVNKNAVMELLKTGEADKAELRSLGILYKTKAGNPYPKQVKIAGDDD